MADDSYEKTEEPTPKKLEDAREKGQIARSKELSTALVLVSSAIAFFLLEAILQKPCLILCSALLFSRVMKLMTKFICFKY